MAGRRKWPWQAWLAFFVAAAVLTLGGIGVWLIHQERSAATQWSSPQLDEARQGLDEISIDAKLDVQNHSLTVTQTLTLTSRTEESRDTLVLRTWPNAFQKPDTSPIAGNDHICPDGFSAGSLSVTEVVVEQNRQISKVAHRYLDEAKTALALPLAESWQPGETIMVILRYTVRFPHAMYRFGWWEDAFMAGQAFAVPAPWQDGAYRTDAYLPIGDPLSGECANYLLSLTVPAGYTCATTGSIVGTSKGADGFVQYLVDAPAVREIGLVIGPQLRMASRSENGVLVQALAESDADAQRMLDTAAAALACFSERYGGYPYPTYTVCAAPMGVSGAEYPGLSMIAASLLEGDAETLEYAIAHETAHQWWYSLVGSDSSTHPWQDEAMCEFSLLDYVESRYGRAAREELRQTRVETAMKVTVAGQATPGAPLDYFETDTDYMVLAYGRAASLLCAVDDLLGGRLDETLRAYAERYAFATADRADFTRLVLEETGVDIEPLMIDYLDTYLIN